MTRSDLVDISVTLVHETDKAWLLDLGDDEEVWIPKSQAELERNGRGWTLTCPEWLAMDKGLI